MRFFLLGQHPLPVAVPWCWVEDGGGQGVLRQPQEGPKVVGVEGLHQRRGRKEKKAKRLQIFVKQSSFDFFSQNRASNKLHAEWIMIIKGANERSCSTWVDLLTGFICYSGAKDLTFAHRSHLDGSSLSNFYNRFVDLKSTFIRLIIMDGEMES